MIYFIYYILFLGITIHCPVFAENVTMGQNDHQSFSPILNKIVSANKRRMETLNAIARLEDYLTRINGKKDELQESADEQDQRGLSTLLEFVNKNASFRRLNDQNVPEISNIFVPVKYVENNVLHNSEIKRGLKQENVTKPATNLRNNQGIEINDTESVEENHSEKNVNVNNNRTIDNLLINLRRSWMDTCSRKAAKVCTKACNTAYNNFCRHYNCSSRAKKNLRKECKINCKTKFQLRNYDE